MSKSEREILEAMQWFGETTADVAIIAQALVATGAGDGVRGEIYEDLKEACEAQREAAEAVREAQEALIVDTVGESLEGVGGMVS